MWKYLDWQMRLQWRWIESSTLSLILSVSFHWTYFLTKKEIVPFKTLGSVCPVLTGKLALEKDVIVKLLNQIFDQNKIPFPPHCIGMKPETFWDRYLKTWTNTTTSTWLNSTAGKRENIFHEKTTRVGKLISHWIDNNTSEPTLLKY